MHDLTEFYRGKRVLITGHTGFKGAWLTLWLSSMGAHVHGYALDPPTTPSLFAEARVATRLASQRIADVRDAAALAGYIREVRPEIVFHLAAQALVRLSYEQPRATYETNITGTVNLLEAVRAAPGVRVCQIITSDKCYENREWAYAYRENDPMGGADPYSNSKGCVELIVSAYRRSFFAPEHITRHGLSLASARAGNVIGGGDWARDRIIPDCVRALQAGESILVRNPHAIRPWQFVLEPLSGYLLLARRQWEEPARFADAFNFGPSAEGMVPVARIVEQVLHAWGTGTFHSPPQAGAVHEASFLQLDITKAATLLKWRPVLPLAEAIRMTIDHYRQRASADRNFDAAAACLGQIQSYGQRRAAQEPT